MTPFDATLNLRRYQQPHRNGEDVKQEFPEAFKRLMRRVNVKHRFASPLVAFSLGLLCNRALEIRGVFGCFGC
jgi:hypothetical protein